MRPTAPKVGTFGIISLTVAILTFIANGLGVAAATQYLPPTNPPSNIAASPNYSSSPSCYTISSTGQYLGTQSAACTSVEMQAVNNAQTTLGEPTITLPSNWQSLTNPERLFVFISLERISLGLPPYVGMDAQLNTAAQQAAVAQTDPSIPSGWPLAYNSSGYPMFGGTWSGGWPGMGTLAAQYGWLYADGWDYATNSSSNEACTSPTSTGCWAHRDELLGSTEFGTAPISWGVGLYCTTCVLGAGFANSDASTTILVAKPSVADSQLSLSFTWAAETPYLAGSPPSLSYLSPVSGLTTGGTAVTFTGSNFSTTQTTTVNFGTTSVTATCISSTTCQAQAPAEAAGTVAVSMTAGGQTVPAVTPASFTYITPTASSVGSVYHAVSPLRLLDTRTNNSNLGPHTSFNLSVVGGSVPSTANAVALNVTTTETTTASYLTVYPTGEAVPLVSNSNWLGGQTVSNLVIVPIGSNGSVSFYNDQGSTALVVDLEGYFTPNTNNIGEYMPLSPARITDTRSNSGYPNAGKTLGTNSTLNVQATGVGGVPSQGVAAVVVNLTVTDTTAASYLTAYPAGESRPLASNLNWGAGETIAKRVIVPVNPTTGQISLYNDSGSTDVVVDVTGYFTATASTTGSLYYPTAPFRLLDTRQTNTPLGPQAVRSVTISGGGLSTAITAVEANVTVTNTTASSYLTIYPDNIIPLASDLNWTAGTTIPNLDLATVSNGTLNVYNDAGSTAVILDISGYFAPA